MSPEQATGDRAIDGRTDLYALGAVTYEMLAGEPPHTGGTSQAIIARVLTETPRAIRTTRPNVPRARGERDCSLVTHVRINLFARFHSARRPRDSTQRSM
jgi:serine/threonine protein kinase